MKANKLIAMIVSILMIVGLSLAMMPAIEAHAATITVDSLDDPGNLDCATGGCTLREAIAVAGTGDTIEFSVTGTITLNGFRTS